MQRFVVLLLLLAAAQWDSAARADYRITRDHGGLVDEYKAKYAAIRDRGERVIIDRICVTPRASLGVHQAYYDKATTFGVKVTSYAGTADLMTYYPETLKEWIS